MAETDSRNDISDEFHMWLGYCIAKWADIEEHLFHICHDALKSPITQSVIVYYKTPTVAARLTLVGELVLSILPAQPAKSADRKTSAVTEWNEIAKTMNDLLRIRGRLAHHPITTHGQVYVISEDSTGFGELRDGRFAISHYSDTERLRPRERKKPALGLNALKQHFREAEHLAKALRKFRFSTLPRQRLKPPRP
jgi:hypothetical protein